MRPAVPAAAILLIVAGLACREYLSTEPERPVLGIAVKTGSTVATTVLSDTLAWNRADSLMLAIRERPTDLSLLQSLAQLYLDMGWDEQALPPIARGLELAPGSAVFGELLERVKQRLGLDPVDLEGLAAQFRDTVEMWGAGC